jgi:hypothetical protein
MCIGPGTPLQQPRPAFSRHISPLPGMVSWLAFYYPNKGAMFRCSQV